MIYFGVIWNKYNECLFVYWQEYFHSVKDGMFQSNQLVEAEQCQTSMLIYCSKVCDKIVPVIDCLEN